MKNRAQIYRVRRIFKIKNPRYLRSIFPSLFLQINALATRLHTPTRISYPKQKELPITVAESATVMGNSQFF